MPSTTPTATPVASPSPNASTTPTQNVALYSDNNQSCTAGTYFGDSTTGYPGTFYCENSYMPGSSQTPPPAANGDTEYLTSAFQAYTSSNATGTSATSSASFYSGSLNTSKYPVQGTAFAGMQYTMSDTPSVLDFGGNSYFTLDFGFQIPNTTNPVSQNGETYYCTVFDNFTQIGSGSGTSEVGNGTTPFTSTELEGCNTTSNTSNTSANAPAGNGTTNSIAVTLANTTTYNVGDTYTIVLSH